MMDKGGSGLLGRLLQVLETGGLHSMNEVARRLGVNEALVAAMADNLARTGYLVSLDGGCSTACNSCALTGACSAPKPMPSASVMLALTAKGRQAACFREK